MTWDVVVIGGGFGGMTAGLRAAELGLKAVIIERGADADYLCNSRIAGGHVTICMSDPAGPAAPIAEKILTETGGTVTPEFARAYAAHARPMIEWLRGQGIRFIRIGSDPARQWVMAPPRRGQPGLNWKGMGPDVALRHLKDAFATRGGSLRYGSRAVDLVMDSGRCVGVQVQQGTEVLTLQTQAVVLADGGFQGDVQAVRRYISKHPDKLMQRNARSATGDGLRMAASAGAKLVGMDRFYGHPLAREALTNDQLWPHPYLDPMIVHGIVVDSSGKRIVDEGKGAVYVANVIAARENPLDAFVVFDERVWSGPAADITAPPAPNPTLRTCGATIYSADTIEQLAHKAGIPVQAFVATVEGFNRCLGQCTLTELDPIRSDAKVKPEPIRKPPFYAIPMCVGLTYTMGGPAIDSNARVLDESDRPIEGLFAVGSTCGGLEGGPFAGYLGGLAKAFIFGLRAAERIAHDLEDGSPAVRMAAGRA